MMFIAGVFLDQREQSMNAKASLCSVCRLFLIGGRDRAWSAGIPKSGAWSSAPKQCNQGKSRPWTWCCVSRASYSSLVISGQNLKSQRPAPAAADYRDNAFTDGHRLIGFSVRPCETKQPAKCVGNPRCGTRRRASQKDTIFGFCALFDAPVATLLKWNLKTGDRVHDKNHEKWVVSLTISSLKRSSKYMFAACWLVGSWALPAFCPVTGWQMGKRWKGCLAATWSTCLVNTIGRGFSGYDILWLR